MGKEIDITDGFIYCEECHGSGKIYKTLSHRGEIMGEYRLCPDCKSSGYRVPTWTEKIVYRNQLKDCPHNELQTWKERKKV